ncbi:MAG: phosphonate C-P lyase system protein PhnG [Polaromonas sp.]|nr:phosphonate C-P lyase system protein PhnG [Polaromonas sp.]
MTNEPTNTNNARRRRWLGVLSRAARPALEAALARLDGLAPLVHVRPSEAGMVMLRGRVGGTGDAFNLGEASVTRCALRMGTGPLGVGYTLGRDRRKAELIAIFDALLQDEARQGQLQRELIEPLAGQQALQRDAASRSAAASKVEFITFVRGES